MRRLKNFIDNTYCEPASKRYLPNENPSTGEVYSEIPDSDERDIDLAVQAAKKAFPLWSNASIEDRNAILLRIADLIKKRKKEFAIAESTDQGKTFRLAYDIEMNRVIKNFEFFTSLTSTFNDTGANTGKEGFHYSRREAIGVAGLISPWNLPLYLLTWKIAPALACGNTVVCKPSELTPMTAYLLTELFQEAKLPKGVCNIVFGTGQKAGDALTKHPDVPLISFTGGTETAKAIQKNALPYYKKLSLELGGKNPSLVFNDADLEDCIKTTLRSSFQNQGEICLCNSRVFVQKGIYERFLEEFLKATKNISVGDPMDEKIFYGPLINRKHMEKVLSYIDIAKKEGAEILTGGKACEVPEKFKNGYFLEPTIIASLQENSPLMQEEIFGPVVCLYPFDTEEDAIRLANNTKYGLSASVWTKDIKQAHRVAHSIEAGTVWINSWMVRDLRVPFGGMKASGIGREGGQHSIDFYTEAKDIYVKL